MARRVLDAEDLNKELERFIRQPPAAHRLIRLKQMAAQNDDALHEMLSAGNLLAAS
jgi:hypothetical protein